MKFKTKSMQIIVLYIQDFQRVKMIIKKYKKFVKIYFSVL